MVETEYINGKGHINRQFRDSFTPKSIGIINELKGMNLLEFREHLTKKHLLKEGERKLKEISINQYINRFDNMRRDGIYNEETQISKEFKNVIRIGKHILGQLSTIYLPRNTNQCIYFFKKTPHWN